MFNLGTKTVVLNSNANVTEANGVISIAGFGTLQSQQLLLRQEDKEFLLQKCSGRCVHPLSYTLTILKRTTLYLVFAQKVLSNIFSDIDVWTPI
jgi:hypothetical protein